MLMLFLKVVEVIDFFKGKIIFVKKNIYEFFFMNYIYNVKKVE